MVVEVAQATSVNQAQAPYTLARETLGDTLLLVDRFRGILQEAEAVTSAADLKLAEAVWNDQPTAKLHQEVEAAVRRRRETQTALELVPDKLREGLRDFWESEIALAEAQAQQEEAEAQEGREEELAPLVAAWGRERAEAHLEKEYALPEVHGSVRLGDNGNYETVFPTGSVVTVLRPSWFISLHVGLPSRQKRVLGLGKQIQTLGDRTPEDLEKTARKLAEQPEA